MEFIGKIKDISMDLIGGGVNITLSTDKSILPEYQKMKELEKLDIKIVKFRKKRSLDANAYSWVLIGKMAGVLRTDNDSVYIDMLRKYGQTAIDADGNAVIITLKSKVDISTIKGIYYAQIGTGFINGIECTNYRLIQGQSTYDTVEMARFIDGIVSECKELEIETVSPNEIREMKERWGV